MANTGEDTRTAGITILATLGIAAALYLGGEFLAPIAVAVVLSALFRPIVRKLQQLRVPAPLGAAIVVGGLLAVVVGGGFALAEPIRGWFDRAPQYLSVAKGKLDQLRKPINSVLRVADDVKQVAAGPTTAPATTGPTTEPAPTTSTPPTPSPSAGISAPVLGFGTRLFGSTAQVFTGVAEVLLLLYFILASGGKFFRKLVHVLHAPEDKQAADDAVHEAEAVIRRYMLVNVFVNFGQGVVVAIAMAWLGMPAPILWGLLAFVLEFVPFLGGVVMVVLLTGMALASFDSVGKVLAAPGIYLLISTIQNNLVSPYAYGSRLNLNPVAVLVGVLFWWTVWGTPGAFIAVPILATMRIIAERTDRFRPVAEFLGD